MTHTRMELGARRDGRALIWPGAVVVVAVACCLVFLVVRENRRRADRSAFSEAQQVNSIAGYGEYARDFPAGGWTGQAASLAWKLAQTQGDKAAYGEFAKWFPESEQAAEARLWVEAYRQSEVEFAQGHMFYLFGHEPEKLPGGSLRCQVRYLRNPSASEPPARIGLARVWPLTHSPRMGGVWDPTPSRMVLYDWEQQVGEARGIISYDSHATGADWGTFLEGHVDKARPFSIYLCTQGPGDQETKLSNEVLVPWAEQ